MLDFPRWKTIGISIILLLGILFSIPSFLPEKAINSLPSFLQAKVNLGLDLAGGSHLLLESRPSPTSGRRSGQHGKDRAHWRCAASVVPTTISRSANCRRRGGKISFLVRDQAKLDEARERLFSETAGRRPDRPARLAHRRRRRDLAS